MIALPSIQGNTAYRFGEVAAGGGETAWHSGYDAQGQARSVSLFQDGAHPYGRAQKPLCAAVLGLVYRAPVRFERIRSLPGHAP